MHNRSKPTNGKLKMIQDHEKHVNERARKEIDKKKKRIGRIEIDLDDSDDIDSEVSRSSSQFEVEEICGRRVNRGVVEYYIKWKNYGEKHNTWEREANLVYVKKWLEQYDQKQARKLNSDVKQQQRGKKLVCIPPPMKIGKVINEGFPPPIVSPVPKITLNNNSSYDSLQSTPMDSSKNQQTSRQESLRSASNSKSKSKEKVEKAKSPAPKYSPRNIQIRSKQSNSSKKSISIKKDNALIDKTLPFDPKSKEMIELKKQHDYANNFYTEQELDCFVKESEELLEQLRLPQCTKNFIKPIFMYTDIKKNDPQGTDSWNSSLDFPQLTEQSTNIDQLRYMIEGKAQWPSNYKLTF